MSPSPSCRRPALQRALARAVAGVGMATAAMALLATSAGATEATTTVDLKDSHEGTVVDQFQTGTDCGAFDLDDGPVWHFVAVRVAPGTPAGTLTASFGPETEVVQDVQAAKVNQRMQHFYVQSTQPVLVDASVELAGTQGKAMLVLSHVCLGTGEPDTDGPLECEDLAEREGFDAADCQDPEPCDPATDENQCNEPCDPATDENQCNEPELGGGGTGGTTPVITIDLTPVRDEAPLVLDEAIEADTPAPQAEVPAPVVESLTEVPVADVVEETPAAPVVTAQAAGDPVVAGRTTLPRTGASGLAPAGLGTLLLGAGIALNVAAARRRTAVR